MPKYKVKIRKIHYEEVEAKTVEDAKEKAVDKLNARAKFGTDKPEYFDVTAKRVREEEAPMTSNQKKRAERAKK